MTVLYINKYINILETIFFLKAATAKTITILTDNSDETYIRKILYRMEKEGYTDTTRTDTGKKVYYLTDKGIRELGERNRRYEPNSNLYHLLTIGTVCSYLRITQGAAPEDMITDIRAGAYIKAGRHRPDIIHGCTAYEVELHSKAQDRETAAVYSNSLYYQRQIWIIPENRNGIIKGIRRASERTGAQVEIITAETIERTVEAHRTQETGNIDIIRQQPLFLTGTTAISEKYGRFLYGNE